MTATDWTNERVERLRALWLEGHSASAIARTLGDGATRSAVLGKLHRLGVRRPVAATPRHAAAPSKPARLAPPKRRSAAPRAQPGRPTVSPEPLTPLATLLSVRQGGCRWPCGEPGSNGLPVCGRPVSRGAYCACHAAVSYLGRRPTSLLSLAGLSEG